MIPMRSIPMSLKSRAAGPSHGPRLRSGAVVFCLLLLTALRLLAESYYLTPGRPDGIALLAPPPAPGSAEAAADLASARAVFDARTPAEQARAFKDASLSLFLFEPAIGPFFKPGRLPKTEALFQKVKTDIAEAINIPKEYWKRQRPCQLDERLSLGAPEKSFGYPSGHSARGTVYSLVLAEVFPEQREAILAIGRDIGWDRVLIGKHFPTDIHAGRVLGQAIVRELRSSPAFQRDLAEARAEAQAAQRREVAPGIDGKPVSVGADSPAGKSTPERVVGRGSN
jgi:acid phosphatase (class A)